MGCFPTCKLFNRAGNGACNCPRQPMHSTCDNKHEKRGELSTQAEGWQHFYGSNLQSLHTQSQQVLKNQFK